MRSTRRCSSIPMRCCSTIWTFPCFAAAVKEVAGRVVTEASGGVTLDTVAAIAETGVDLISVGALTHSAPVLDIGLDFDPQT